MGAHNDYFLHMFGHKEITADLLRAYLPSHLSPNLDFATLTRRDPVFPKGKKQGARRADLVWSVKEKEGKEIYIFLHLEHQSTYDEHMGIRLLEYQVALLRALIKEQAPPFPPVFPLVIYHNKKKWQSPHSIADMFTDGELYLSALRNPFVIDLSHLPVATLQAGGRAYLPSLVFSRQPTHKMKELLPQVAPLTSQVPKCCQEATYGYMVEQEEEGEEVFLQELRNFDKETANKYSIMFERALKKERAQGIEQGIKQGRIKTTREFVKSLKELNLSLDTIEKATRLTEKEVKAILSEKE